MAEPRQNLRYFLAFLLRFRDKGAIFMGMTQPSRISPPASSAPSSDFEEQGGRPPVPGARALNIAHLCVIDGSNMLHRAWAMGGTRVRQDGVEVAAADLFSKMVMKLMRRMMEGRHPPSHVAIFFDPAREQSWRRKIYPDYKADRSEMDPALAAQIPMMQQMCTRAGIAWAVAPEHEADDLIAAYVEDAAAGGARCSIVSTDKDLMQLVRPGILQLTATKDVWFNEAAVFAKFGVPPLRVADFLALAGDKVDGVPGAPGIGAKTAAKLLTEFGSLGAILREPEKLERASWQKSISQNLETIRMSRLLVSLDHAGAPRPLDEKTLRTPRMGEMIEGVQSWRREELDDADRKK